VLRAALGLLVAANLLFLAFTQGWLDGVSGLKAIGDREPERLGKQVRPEAVTLWPAGPASDVAAAATCHEAGPFNAADAFNVEATLRAQLPPGSWVDHRNDSFVGSALVTTHTYRVSAADPALATRLAGLRLDAGGRGFNPCPEAVRPR